MSVVFGEMRLKLNAWLRQNKGWLIGAALVIVIVLGSKPILWPDGLGTQEGKSVTTSVEKDKFGNVVKSVETTKTDPGKTLWDWLSLLGVPLSLAIFGYWLQQLQQERAADEVKEEVLQAYFDRLSTLLVDKNLLALAVKANSTDSKTRATTEEQELLDTAVDVIRARTLSILRRFEKDKERKTSVIRFLIEADIISKLKLSLTEANLSFADLRDVNLKGADLREANLTGAYLRDANLKGADLRKADLRKANLCWAYLREADLREANFTGAYLRGAILTGAKREGAKGLPLQQEPN